MKKLLFSLTILASFLAVSCQKSDDFAPGQAENPNGAWFAFSDDAAAVNPTEYSLDADATSFAYKLSRYTGAGELTVRIINHSESIFTVPETVTFQNGSTEADLIITFSDVPAKNSLISLEIAPENAALYGQGSAKFTGYLNKMWMKLGEGLLYDSFTMSSAIEPVVILKSRVSETYRIVDPYADSEAVIADWGNANGPACPFIEIEEYKKDNETFLRWDKFWYNTVMYNGDSDPIKAYLPSVLDASLEAGDKLNLWCAKDIMMLQPYWYIDGLGGFGQGYPVYVALPGVSVDDFDAFLSEVLG